MAVDRRSVEMLLFAFLARYMIRPLCKQVWGMTAYLDLSSTDRAAFIELLRTFLSSRSSDTTTTDCPKSYLTTDIIYIFLNISHKILSSH